MHSRMNNFRIYVRCDLFLVISLQFALVSPKTCQTILFEAMSYAPLTAVFRRSSNDQSIIQTFMIYSIKFLFWHNSLQWPRASSFTRLLDHTK